ncbi:MAG: Fe-S cluster assembly ATPase SufC [Candidatus Pacebacteria bacterium]|nr:Fe-S cluster assembly ATPase SufC [Candidatus Paceibacterota bacterium]
MRELAIQHISVAVDGKEVVHDVSFTLASGEVAVLMGPNGSGKSTLVNALMGHPDYEVREGALLLDGEDITALPVHEKAQKGLFLSLQHTPRVGGINLATFLHKVHIARTGECVDVLEYYLYLREIAQRLSINEDLLDRPITAGLSGGEKKLSEVLQLAALKPRFAILDEIDAGVDVDAMKKVFKAVSVLAGEGTGFLVISHQPALLTHVYPVHVFLMADGRLVRSAGRELAEEIHRDGFCKAIKCPKMLHCGTECG